jgi:hypothetical protein
MGFLAAAIPAIASAGSSILGLGTAAGAASTSLAATAISTGLSVGSQVLGGLDAAKQQGYAAEVMRKNAAFAKLAGEQARASGSYAESVARIKSGQLGAAQKAGFAANGIDVSSGSVQDVMSSSAAMGDIDALAIRYNAEREAFGNDIQAANYASQAAQAKKAGRNSILKGVIGGANSFLSGAAALSDKWAAYKTEGAL